MGRELQLHGRYETQSANGETFSAGSLLYKVRDWFQSRHRDVLTETYVELGQYYDARSWLALHPAGGWLEISVRDRGIVTVSALTQRAGPGYHAFLCHTLLALGADLGITWEQIEDDTGYFHTGDRERLEASMLQWLQAVCVQTAAEQTSDLLPLLPADHTYQHEGAVATLLGPRDQEWLQRTAAAPQTGIDVFPWWNEARDAPFFLNRAHCRMWTAIRWREPLLDSERAELRWVHEDLKRAHQLDPALAFPWREWQEILSHLPRATGLRRMIRARAKHAQGPLIGYRRRNVVVHFPKEGWSIEIPGSFAEEWSSHNRWTVSDNVHRWRAWDGEREVQLQPLDFTDPSGRRLPAEQGVAISHCWGQKPQTTWQQDELLGEAHWETIYAHERATKHLVAVSAVPGSIAVCNIYVDRKDRDWAIRTWQTLKCPVRDD